ncbi:LysE family translocator [Streptomyces sp. SS8]
MDSVGLAGFLGVVLLAYLIPGPDFLVITRAAVRRPGLGRAAAMGAQAGLCAHMLAAVLGLSVVAARSSVAFAAIKLAGAAYLVFLGVRALVAVRRGAAERNRRAEPVLRGEGAAPPCGGASPRACSPTSSTPRRRSSSSVSCLSSSTVAGR